MVIILKHFISAINTMGLKDFFKNLFSSKGNNNTYEYNDYTTSTDTVNDSDMGNQDSSDFSDSGDFDSGDSGGAD